MATKRVPATTIHQIKISLRNINPPVWRTLQIESDAVLSKLHRAIQATFDWEDSHLHVFTVGGSSFSEPGMVKEEDVRSERAARLNKVAPTVGSRFVYEYDFGDSWEHDIVVEKILPIEKDSHYPLCIAGKRAAPPEDCGGPWGYADLLEAIGDPSHPEHEEMLGWLAEDFDPEAFDLDMVNRMLKAWV